MRIYWRLGSVPELENLPREERGRAWRRAYGKTFRHWQTWAGVIACGACAATGGAIGATFGLPMIGAGIGGGIGGFIFSQIVIHVARRYYADLLSLGDTR